MTIGPASGHEVPDAAEPVVGWRAWRAAAVGGTWLLRSLNGTPWLPGQALVARCSRVSPRGGVVPEHPAPWSGCTCGIYAALTRDRALALTGVRPAIYVVGQVSLWGRVTTHERGYRAEYAYPTGQMIVMPPELESSRVDDLVQALGVYGSEVTVEPHPRWSNPHRERLVLVDTRPARPTYPMQQTLPLPARCEACGTTTVVDGKCSNRNHAWAAHQRWKIEKKAAGTWTWGNRFDDILSPPPRRGETAEEADGSFRAWLARTVIFGVGFVLMIVANVMCAAIERAAL